MTMYNHVQSTCRTSDDSMRNHDSSIEHQLQTPRLVSHVPFRLCMMGISVVRSPGIRSIEFAPTQTIASPLYDASQCFITSSRCQSSCS